MLGVKEVVRLWVAGLPKKRIAAQLGVDGQNRPAIPSSGQSFSDAIEEK